jgi:hypothetical protein
MLTTRKTIWKFLTLALNVGILAKVDLVCKLTSRKFTHHKDSLVFVILVEKSSITRFTLKSTKNVMPYLIFLELFLVQLKIVGRFLGRKIPFESML